MPTLNWIGKEAVVNHHQQVPFHLLKDVPDLACGAPGDGNLIVQGDNLVALKALLPYYAGQVKCIYIDPPYNTGNEGWAYNDNVNSPIIREWLGQVVGKEGETLDRHDRWLCMMYPRLTLLRQFLREDGAIFISKLVQRIVEIGVDPGDLVLDSFAGSGTTGHAVMKLNAQDGGSRRFILVEMEPNIARNVTAERVRRVAEGYTNAKGERVSGLGGGFRFCTLGEPLFDEDGKIREAVRFADLARHVYFTETGEPLPCERVTKSPFLAACRGVGVYLLYNGILEDRSASGGNVLTRAVLAKLPPFDGPKVVYCAGCLLGRERLQAERIIVRQIPYEIKVS